MRRGPAVEGAEQWRVSTEQPRREASECFLTLRRLLHSSVLCRLSSGPTPLPRSTPSPAAAFFFQSALTSARTVWTGLGSVGQRSSGSRVGSPVSLTRTQKVKNSFFFFLETLLCSYASTLESVSQ